MRQLVYTLFSTNNHASFHLWWKENLVKYQKFSKYYDHDYCYYFGGTLLRDFQQHYVSMKENHADNEIADKNLVKSDHITQGLIQQQDVQTNLDQKLNQKLR